MKFGVCLNMNATGKDKTGIEFVERAARFGFDYVELPLAEMTALDEADFQGIAARVRAAGIPCETCNNFFPKEMRLTGKNADHETALAYAKKALARAKDIGAKIVVFGSGGAKNVPEGFPLEQGFAQVVDLLRKIAPIARENGITIAIEPLRKAECNLINTFYEGCTLARAVDRAEVRVLVDYYHFMTEHEPLEHILTDGKAFLRHTHFARVQGRTFPQNLREDEGYLPYFEALRAAGYDARLSLEAYTQDFDLEAPKALAFFKENL